MIIFPKKLMGQLIGLLELHGINRDETKKEGSTVITLRQDILITMLDVLSDFSKRNLSLESFHQDYEGMKELPVDLILSLESTHRSIDLLRTNIVDDPDPFMERMLDDYYSEEGKEALDMFDLRVVENIENGWGAI